MWKILVIVPCTWYLIIDNYHCYVFVTSFPLLQRPLSLDCLRLLHVLMLQKYFYFHLFQQTKKEIEMKGVWPMPSKYSEEGVYRIQYSVIKEAEHHCLLHSPIPVTCPVRLLHGMKDDVVPWHTAVQVADRVVSTDVDVILRKNSDHRMKEKADIQLLVYTIDDLIDKLSTIVH